MEYHFYSCYNTSDMKNAHFNFDKTFEQIFIFVQNIYINIEKKIVENDLSPQMFYMQK